MRERNRRASESDEVREQRLARCRERERNHRFSERDEVREQRLAGRREIGIIALLKMTRPKSDDRLKSELVRGPSSFRNSSTERHTSFSTLCPTGD